jgi:CSLREA domain-containing protein
MAWPVRSVQLRPFVVVAVVALALVGFPVARGVVFASPAQFTVNSTADALDASVGDGVCSTVAGACTLRAAIQEANANPGADEIQLPPGTYELGIAPLNQNDVTTGDLDITDSLTITGAGASSTIVDGGTPTPGGPARVRGLDRLFEVLADSGEVSFSGLTFSDGYAAEYGGAVMNNSTATVTVIASTLTGNVADKAGGAIDNHLGGALHVENSTLSNNVSFESASALNNQRDGTLSVANSDILSNSAADVALDESVVGAGAIANNAELDARGTITVTGSLISDNAAGGSRAGAALSNDGAGTVTVDQTTFSKNRAEVDGGAIFNGAGEVTVTGSTFSENSGESGGAIFNSAKDGRLTVSDSSFSLNTADARGGAIASGGTGHLTVTGSTFSKNSADGWGGAIVNDDKGSASIQNSTFRENAGLNGGGFANEGDGLVTVENSTFAKNAAFVTAVLASGEGGGMQSNSGGDVVVTGGAFTENTARDGGGFGNEGGGTVTITGTRFSANHADEKGGGILIQSGTVRMLDIDVIGNIADAAIEAGGGIAYEGDKLVSVGEAAAIENSRILDNEAKGQGGGIDSRGDGPLDIVTTTIARNSAAMGGGIHHVGDAPLDVNRSTLSGNFAEGGGGLFTDGDGETGVENTTVSGNRAGQFGGGLLVSSRLNIRNSTVASNNAASGGGINNGGGDLVGDGTVFLLNTIVANSPTGGNCQGTMTSLGGNLDSGNTCQFRELSDHPGTDPRLGPLADNGGPTRTHALLSESPAQEKAVCTDLVPCPPVDQRGVARPIFVGNDIGAYESELTPGGGGDQPCTGRTERPVLADFDSWISESVPGANFGSDSILKVKSLPSANQRALVHFTLPSIPPGCKVVGATLRLYSPAAVEGRTLEALRLASGWSEFGATWDNQPETAGPAATTQSGREFREWDVLEQTRDMYAFDDHGFLIRDAAEGESGEQSFHSSEKGIDRPPELILIFDDKNAQPPPVTCPTTPQIIAADQDSWINEASPFNNFGNESALKVKSQAGSQFNYNARALVRFPLPPLPAACTSIASATLRLDAQSATVGRTLEARQIASAWGETDVTWSNQPGTTGPVVTTQSAEGPVDWHVTAQVLDMYTSANHGWLIRDAEENGVGEEQTFNGRLKLNDGPPELVVVFDDSTPETVIDSGPPDPTDSTEAAFSFSSDREDATFECSLDGATFEACNSGHAVTGLTEGHHVFEVRATRKVRAVDPTPARYEWTVAIPPETRIDRGPDSPSASPDALVAFSADDPDAIFECSLNGADFEGCTSPRDYTNLADGENEVRVRGIDPLGNVEPTPASHVWIVAVPPETTIDSGPPALGNGTSARFEFSGTDNGPQPPALTFECKLDTGDWGPCSSGQAYLDLTDGQHTFEVRATDPAGNVEAEPAARTWMIDTLAPKTSISAGPPGLTNSTSASFEFDADEAASSECKLDTGDWEACVSPREYAGLADGGHTFLVRATDLAGNLGAEASRVWTVDTVAPTATVDAGPADPTNSTSASFEFSADEAGASFDCRLDAADWEACTKPRDYDLLVDGVHTFLVRATDRAGNLGAEASYSWMVDTVAPTATVDAGPPRLGNSTSASFEFSADEAAVSFDCRLDAGEWTACTAPQSYSLLDDGEHTFSVRATDRAGNLGGEASYSWMVDTVTPTATVDQGPADPTNSTTASFEFSADETADFECKLDSGDWAGCASPQEYRDLADGQHAFSVRATDRAGNLGAEASYVWTVDTVAPDTTISARPADPSNSATARFEFGADEEASFECLLDAGEGVSCSSGQTYADLADGQHTFQVRATDRAGNRELEPAAFTWTVDTVAPDTTFSARPADPSNSAAARFEFGAEEEASFECLLDAGEWLSCSSGQTYADLADRQHTFQVRATDRAGNGEVEPAAFTWTVDTVAPETTIVTGPAELTNSTSAGFAFSASEAGGFECRLDAGDWTGCTSPQDYTTLADGEHTFAVRAVDLAGNVDPTPATYSWTVDTVAPTATVDRGPADPTNSTAASFEFSSNEAATFECRLDAGEWAPCSGAQAYADLGNGIHTFAVRPTDQAGNLGRAALNAWTVDTVAPDTKVDKAPSDPSNDRAPSFEFSAGESATFECLLDAGEWVSCSSGQAYAELSDGVHTFQVRATDLAGNNEAEPAVHVWTIDTVAPTVRVDAGPPTRGNSRAASFEFSADEAGASFECRLDAGAWAACTAPKGYSLLGDGEHTFSVRAIDRAGNVGAAADYVWTVDTVAPDTKIDKAPSDPSNDRAPSFGFSADEVGASFECRLDAGEWAACMSPQGYTGLGDGEHTFMVRATDRAGNAELEPAAFTWTIDTVAPTTTIDAAPSNPSNDRAPSFEFSADERPASFECKLDAGEWTRCTSPQGYTALADGEHTFQVRATDATGNLGGPATFTWTIEPPRDGVAPDTTITGTPADPSNSRSATFGFTGSDNETPASAIAFQCRLDSQAPADFASCTSPETYTALSEGRHTFEVRAVDAAGNADPTPASYSWTVDTVAPQATIDSGPAGATSDSTPTFGFSSEPGASFQCRVDNAAFAVCTSPHATAALSDGAHSFEVRASDAAGNTGSAASRAFTVDTAAPQTTITSGPPATTSSTSGTFTFTANQQGSSFECSLDGAAFTACTSPRDYTGLASGAHHFSVRASDAVGNTDATPATHSWTISSPPPGCGPAATALAAADAWIDENSPASNKGSDSVLKVQSKGPRDNFRALVRFTLPSVPQGCVVESATLRLYSASARTGRTLHALRVSAPWSEHQVAWDNQPETTGSAAAAASGLGYREWNVTSHVQAMYAEANNGILIRDAVEGQDAEQQFHSREKGESPPQLVVRFASAGG